MALLTLSGSAPVAHEVALSVNYCGIPRSILADLGATLPQYGLRHTHASQLIDAGVDIVTISKRLGHASPAITMKVYAHLFQQSDAKAADAINAALAGLGQK